MTPPIPATSLPGTLRLIVPGFAMRVRTAGMPALPVLEKLLRRGTITETHRTLPGFSPWHLDVLALLGLPSDRLHASAPLEWLGQGGEPLPGSWLHAEFVHLEMGARNARLHPIEALDPASAAAFTATLAAHLQDAGFKVLEASAPLHFFLHTGQRLEALCPLPDFDAVADVQGLLPQGRSGAGLRRLLTEAQMLLHDHPANLQRERAGLRAVNAIWLSGLGDFESFQPLSLPHIWSDEPILRGLCRLHGGASLPLPKTAAEWLKDGRSGAIVMPASDAGDPAAILQRLETDWFAPLAAAISAGQLSAVELFLDRWHVSIDRPALRRFWRRGRPLSGLLQ